MSKRQSEDIGEEYGFRRSAIEDVYDGWNYPKWYEKECRSSTGEIYNLWYVVRSTPREKVGFRSPLVLLVILTSHLMK